MNDKKYTVRLAAEEDIPGIISLMEARGKEYMKRRSADDIATFISKKSAVLVCNDGGTISTIIGYFEALTLIASDVNEEERNKITTKEYGRLIPCQHGDVLFLWGATVAAKAFQGLPKIMSPWFRDHLGPLAERTLQNGNKVITLLGSMADTKAMTNKISENWLNALLGNTNEDDPARKKWPIHKREFPAKMPDGTGRQGFLVLLHVDPPLTAHQSTRLSRNACLIQDVEQRRLLQSSIGIVGLSTGSVVLEVLLRQGVGGTYRIADHDVFDLSNANRMFYGTPDIGQSKADLCAAKIKSVDPVVVVDKYPQGITSDNIEDFVKGCDLIVEECDDFAIKLQLRLVARKYKVPIDMGTSQNGMIDIERYDEDSECRPFHLHDFPSDLSNLTLEEKTALLSKMFTPDQFSPRMLEALPHVGTNKSLPSWPQLAEEVTLNAATVTHAVRRILVGDSTVISGRFGIRMDQLFQPQNRLYPSAKM